MKVCLCSIPTERPEDIINPYIRSQGDTPILPKVAISSLINAMITKGFTDWDFYDIDMLMPTDIEIRDYFSKNKIDVIGLSAVVSSSYPQVKRIAKIIREVSPTSWIVVGGNLSAIADIILRKSEIDVCFVGEGEISWVEFLSYVERNKRNFIVQELEKLKGIAFIDKNDKFHFTGYGNKIQADEITLADYSIMKIGLKDKPELMKNYFRIAKNSAWLSFDERVEKNTSKPYLAHITTSKGCTAKCTFCQRSINGYRVIDLSKMEEQLIILKEEYDVGFLSVVDENFGSSVSYTHEVAKLFKKHDMIWFASGVRCTNVSYDDIKFYKENNCVALKFGVESGSQTILDIMEKKFTLEDVSEAINHCISLDILSPLAVMVGMPGETNHTVLETAKLIGTMAHKLGLPPKQMGWDMFYAMAFPGSSLYVYGQQIGVISKDSDGEEKYLSSIANPTGDKYNHVNLSGQKIKDVVFWDQLIKLESRRIYHELNIQYGKQAVNHAYKDSINRADGSYELNVDSSEVRQPSKLSKILFYFTKGHLFRQIINYTYRKSIFLNKLLESDLAIKLPRKLIYPILRNLFYFKYTVFKALGGIEDILVKSDKKINNELLSSDVRRKEKSLRSMIPSSFDMDTEEGKVLSLRRGA